ncbi:OLC1v1009996C1 [Oldenlandia corymbosa var. corymbosa]|uniref:OLC1v1009996C1 n=1 Tax=Oldenlandia corymbosa var. corymbosa TaxID=529605 RepID=A0AAV1DQ89_OLDCO|nr:OLC1v1009996C1 [Oldenlandia corymbosa var. corymbosa]
MRRSVGKSSGSHEFPAPENQYPWLVYRHGEDTKYQTFCTIKSSSSGGSAATVKKISELRRQGIVYCSPDGNRILLTKFTPGSQQFYACSVKEDEVIHLPLLGPRFESNIIHHGLMMVNTDSWSSLLVLLFVEQSPLLLYFQVGDLDRKWKEFNYAQSIQAQTGYPLKPQYFLCSPVNFNGTIYATASGCTDLSSTSCLAPNPYVANRIYFPKFYKDELVYYSLSTKRYHSAGSQQELQSINETIKFVDCAWIQPSWT